MEVRNNGYVTGQSLDTKETDLAVYVTTSDVFLTTTIFKEEREGAGREDLVYSPRKKAHMISLTSQYRGHINARLVQARRREIGTSWSRGVSETA